MQKLFRTSFIAFAVLVCSFSALGFQAIGGRGIRIPFGDWTSTGQDRTNKRQQPLEFHLNASNAKNLTVKWAFPTNGGITSTPTVSGNNVYVSDWAGNLYAIEKTSGALIWKRRVSDYNGVTGAVSRVSPLVLDNKLVIGDNVSSPTSHSGASLIAVDRETGGFLWLTKVDEHPAAVITGSPVAVGDVIYVGISSNEENLAAVPGYDCCTFRGSVVAVSSQTGKILWKTYTVPDNHGLPNGYSGAAVWQTSAIDLMREQLYVGTGNNYNVPAAVEDCETAALLDGGSDGATCTSADDHFDSVMALDRRTGAIKWAKKFSSYDTWTVACLKPAAGVTCPSPKGPDYDFGGSGPNFLGGVVGIGQKSGIYWALKPETGDILWSTAVGPGGSLGGIQWGTASDGERIYVPIGNAEQTSYQLSHSGQSVHWGSWAALNAETGSFLWQVVDPTVGAMDIGAASVANGIVFVGSYSGFLYALDATNGSILWQYATGAPVSDGPAISDGMVFWGSGSKKSSNNNLYAFSLKN